MQAQKLSLPLEGTSRTAKVEYKAGQPGSLTLDALSKLDTFRAEWKEAQGERLAEGYFRLDSLDLGTRRRNNLQALYRVLMELPTENIRYHKQYGICLYPGGYTRLAVAGIGGKRDIIKGRLDDLVQAGLINEPRHEYPRDRFSQLVIPLPHASPLCQPEGQTRQIKFKKPTKRVRKKIEKPGHYRRLNTVTRLRNFLGYATLAVLQTQPGLKAKEIADIRGVKIHVVWADLRMAKKLGLVEKRKTRYFPAKASETLKQDQLDELDTCSEARQRAISGLHRAEHYYERTGWRIDMTDQAKQVRRLGAFTARKKVNRVFDGESLSRVFGLREEA